METITRNFLEIKSLNNLLKVNKPTENAEINLLIPPDFQLNKFLYNKIGKKYNWVDRLIWTDQDWIKYVSRFDMYTYILKVKNEIAGFFEFIFHKEKFEIEIVYLGLLEEYIGKKLGGYLLSEAIKKSFEFKINRVWLHTCSLDNEHALKNLTNDQGREMIRNKVRNELKKATEKDQILKPEDREILKKFIIKIQDELNE